MNETAPQSAPESAPVSRSPSVPPRVLHRRERVLRFASVLALVGLGFMVWSVLDPRPMPVILGLSVGQGIGTFSFLLYLVVVASDLGVRKKLDRRR